MQEEYTLSFGAHKGKTLLHVAKENPGYIQWIAGRTTKFALTSKGKDMYAMICQEHAADVQACKDFVKDKCQQCWRPVSTGERHFCHGMRATSNYHYHPYGKRT